ncbi:uncharacterized protein perm1a [Pholidichthys leucotaenia]
MEDFEYSVEISDRDWDCFFAECEECNLLPPSLAGVDDSGMSDIDDAGSIFAKREQRLDPPAGFSEGDHPIDGPPHCEGSPVEHYLNNHGIGGMESILSGSEEDIHLQSVNIFFEKLKSFTEAEPSQVTTGKSSEAVQDLESCSDGKQASESTMPKNIHKLNFLPASSETAAGKETTRPVDTSSNTNTMKKVQSESSIFPESPASNSELKTNKSAEIELFIREEACAKVTVHEGSQWNQSHDVPDRFVSSETSHPSNVESCKSLDGNKLEDLLTSQFSLSKKHDSLLTSNQGVSLDVRLREDQSSNVSQSHTVSTNKAASQEWSPSPSVKRKRRKKRRLSVEKGESGHGHERPVLLKQSDSEVEQHEINVNDLSCSAFLFDGQYQYIPESNITDGERSTGTAKGAAKNDSASNRSKTPLTHTDNVRLAPYNGVNLLEGAQTSEGEISTGLNKYPELQLSVIAGIAGGADLYKETQNEEGIQSAGFQLIDHSVTACENDQNQKCTSEVISAASCLLPSAESNATTVEVIQNDNLSAAKSVLAVEDGNSGRNKNTLRNSEAESQQQLEKDCHNIGQNCAAKANTEFSVCAAGKVASNEKGYPTNPPLFNAKACPYLDEISNKVICTDLSSDDIILSPEKSCLLKCLVINNKKQEIQEDSLEDQTSSTFDILSEKSTEAMKTHSEGLQIICRDDHEESKLTMSEDLTNSISDITYVSSCSTMDTESLSVVSLSNENNTDMSASFCWSFSEQESGGAEDTKVPALAKHKEGDVISEPKDLTESKCDLMIGAEDYLSPSQAESKPEKVPNSVFAMSSFWSEMEKLTINDILSLRMISKASPPSILPPLQEREEMDVFPMADSGFFTQMDKSANEQTIEYIPGVPDSAEPTLSSVILADSSSSRNVMWESEPVPVNQSASIYTENVMASISKTYQPALSETSQNCLRKISKNISMHNLHALESESLSSPQKSETLQTSGEAETEEFDYCTEDRDTDSVPSPFTDSYSISFPDIFNYLFGRKQSVPSQSTRENISTLYTEGNSVPETYDHFFSEFDTENFFYPLINLEEKAKDKTVPIFSCSHSANSSLQFPEAYDYFFASSSSDDSSVESDEEDNCSPIRVVTRFSRKASSSQICTDVYDNFFTDKDLRQNFFWKTTFSFRNINFTASTVNKQRTDSLSVTPMRQKPLSKTVLPLNALGHQDVMLPDPLLYHLEDRISRQLELQPFRYEDLQRTVVNPRLDSSLLPLQQSDMCLVCIAFASWVLKTANPQAGDAWKAVLLANISALSAIRYLRKYIKVEAASSEIKLHHTDLDDS